MPYLANAKGVGDFNGDGYTEIITANNDVVNIDFGSIGSIPKKYGDVINDSVAVADYDQDGIPDIIDRSRNVYSYSASENSLKVVAASNIHCSHFAEGLPLDYDGDGYTEYVHEYGKLSMELTRTGLVNTPACWDALDNLYSLIDEYLVREYQPGQPTRVLQNTCDSFMTLAQPYINMFYLTLMKEDQNDVNVRAAMEVMPHIENIMLRASLIRENIFDPIILANATADMFDLISGAATVLNDYQPQYTLIDTRKRYYYDYNPAINKYTVSTRNGPEAGPMRIIGAITKPGQLPGFCDPVFL